MKTYRNVYPPAEIEQLLFYMAIGGGIGFVASKLLKQEKTVMILMIIAGAVIGKLVLDKKKSDDGKALVDRILKEHPECANADINLQMSCLSRYIPM